MPALGHLGPQSMVCFGLTGDDVGALRLQDAKDKDFRNPPCHCLGCSVADFITCLASGLLLHYMIYKPHKYIQCAQGSLNSLFICIGPKHRCI